MANWGTRRLIFRIPCLLMDIEQVEQYCISKVKSYENAVELLKNLHDLAQYQGDLEEFKNHLARIQQTYSNRPGLLRRMQESGKLRRYMTL